MNQISQRKEAGAITIILVIIILAVIVIIVTRLLQQSKYTPSENTEEVMVKETLDQEKSSETIKNVAMEQENVILESSEYGTYEEYTPEKLALAEGSTVVLFFHASWCPTCRSLSRSIEKGLDTIPENVHILKVDYDTEVALKKKYKVTTQHTLVEIDAEGSLVNTWLGTPSLSTLLIELSA
jgi:thiol-disulfide isomerase/thioredoxin